MLWKIRKGGPDAFRAEVVDGLVRVGENWIPLKAVELVAPIWPVTLWVEHFMSCSQCLDTRAPAEGTRTHFAKSRLLLCDNGRMLLDEFLAEDQDAREFLWAR